MEVKTFPAPAVAGVLNQMIEARLHNDTADSASNEANKALENRLVQSIATPTYVIIDPETEEVLAVRKGAMMDVDKFAAWLKTGLR